MAAYIKKHLIISKIVLAVAIISEITSMVSLVYFSDANFFASYLTTMISTLLFIIFTFIYFVKYRKLSACVKVLKKAQIEYYMDDIDFKSPALPKSKIYCSSSAFFCKTPCLIVPFSQIAWAKNTNQPDCFRFYLANGKSFTLKINPNEQKNFFHRILYANPLFINNTSPEMKTHYYQKYPAALARRKKVQTVWGIIIMAITFLSFLFSYANHNINPANLSVYFGLLIIGFIVTITSVKHFDLLSLKDDILKKIRSSVLSNILFKIAAAVCCVSILTVIILGLLYSELKFSAAEPLFNVAVITALISAVPFFVSIFLKTGFNTPEEYRNFKLPKEALNEPSYFLNYDYNCSNKDYCVYTFFLTFGTDWDYIKDSLGYIVKADITRVTDLKVKAIGETDITKSFLKNNKDINRTPELKTAKEYILLSGISKRLKLPVKIIWFADTRILRIVVPTKNREAIERYAETLLRKSFNTEDSMKTAQPIPAETIAPVSISGQNIFLDVDALLHIKLSPVAMPQYEYKFVIPLTERTPVISVYEGASKTVGYCLQTEGDEDFNGKFFHCSVRVDMRKPLMAALIDGFVADTAEERKMTLKDIGYRMEAYLFRYDPKRFEEMNNEIKGKDLVEKALKFPGYTTPANVRLIGICQKCKKSFAFHGYAFYMAQQDVAYSDNGQRCCVINEQNIDSKTWTYEKDGLIFRYYNSFCCPHCGEPYIDYKNYPEMKQFGVSGCVHLGTEYYSDN